MTPRKYRRQVDRPEAEWRQIWSGEQHPTTWERRHPHMTRCEHGCTGDHQGIEPTRVEGDCPVHTHDPHTPDGACWHCRGIGLVHAGFDEYGGAYVASCSSCTSSEIRWAKKRSDKKRHKLEQIAAGEHPNPNTKPAANHTWKAGFKRRSYDADEGEEEMGE